MLRSQKGFSALVYLLLVTALMVVPVYYLKGILGAGSGDDVAKNIKGANTLSNDKSGLSVTITSSSNWDFVEYLCKNEQDCTQNPLSGKRVSVISGGETSSHEVFIEYDVAMADYEFLKIFFRPAWNSGTKGFEVLDLGEVPGTRKVTLSDDKGTYNVILVPTGELGRSYYESAHFSDSF